MKPNILSVKLQEMSFRKIFYKKLYFKIKKITRGLILDPIKAVSELVLDSNIKSKIQHNPVKITIQD